MKKILLTVFLGIFLLNLIVVGVVSAQEQLNDCCKIRQRFTIGEKTGTPPANVYYEKDDIIGPKTGDYWCDTNGDGTKDTLTAGKETDDWGMVCLINTIYTVTNWIFYILTLVAVLMIVFGGFTYITAAGDPAKAGKGKSILVFAIIGLAIALIAKLIPTLVRFIVGV